MVFSIKDFFTKYDPAYFFCAAILSNVNVEVIIMILMVSIAITDNYKIRR